MIIHLPSTVSGVLPPPSRSSSIINTWASNNRSTMPRPILYSRHHEYPPGSSLSTLSSWLLFNVSVSTDSVYIITCIYRCSLIIQNPPVRMWGLPATFFTKTTVPEVIKDQPQCLASYLLRPGRHASSTPGPAATDQQCLTIFFTLVIMNILLGLHSRHQAVDRCSKLSVLTDFICVCTCVHQCSQQTQNTYLWQIHRTSSV